MIHFYLDQHSGLNSLIHRLDPRTKIITIVIFIFAVITTPTLSVISFTGYAFLLMVIILISKIPPIFVFKRSLIVFPFVFMVAFFIPFFKEGEVIRSYSLGVFDFTVTYDGLLIFWNVLIKSYLSVLCVIVFMASTRLPVFLKGLAALKIPQLFIMIISFMYRYIFVITDELMKMKQAKDSRTIKCSKLYNIKVLANMIVTLFIRSYERAERVYLAMCSRGFNGPAATLNNIKICKRDIYFTSLMVTFLIGVKIWMA